MAVSRFQRNTHGSTTYTCVVCGKNTRETGESESSVEMCRVCYIISGQENSHTDNHEGRMADCVACKESLACSHISIGPEDRWCDRD